MARQRSATAVDITVSQPEIDRLLDFANDEFSWSDTIRQLRLESLIDGQPATYERVDALRVEIRDLLVVMARTGEGFAGSRPSAARVPLFIQFYEDGPSVGIDRRELRGALYLTLAALVRAERLSRRLRLCPDCGRFFIATTADRYCAVCKPTATARSSRERVERKRAIDRKKDRDNLLTKRRALWRELDATAAGDPRWHVIESELTKIDARLKQRKPRRLRRPSEAAVEIHVGGGSGHPIGPDPLQGSKGRNATSRLN